MPPYRLILASTSPYRRELLARLHLPFETAAPDLDETPLPRETPEMLAQRLARRKAEVVASHYAEGLIIGCDQVADRDGSVLGKPLTRDKAIRQLRESSGRPVRFLTALWMIDATSGDARGTLDVTTAWFRSLDEAQITRYVDREPAHDCAGSFKVEGLGIALFERIESDDPSALIGLPLIPLVRLLASFGVAVP